MCSAGDLGSVPGLGRSAREGDGIPLQYSCLETPVDRGAWWDTVHRVAEWDTTKWLTRFQRYPSTLGDSHKLASPRLLTHQLQMGASHSPLLGFDNLLTQTPRTCINSFLTSLPVYYQRIPIRKSQMEQLLGARCGEMGQGFYALSGLATAHPTPSISLCSPTWNLSKHFGWDFPGSPVVKTLHFPCRGHRFDSWLGK